MTESLQKYLRESDVLCVGVLKHGCSASAAESAQQSEFPGNPAKLSGNSCILAFCGSKRRSMF